MSVRDIMPVNSARGGHDKTRWIRMGGATTSGTADTSWEEGEVLTVDEAAGDINLAADGAIDPTSAAALTLVAAASSADLLTLEGGTSGATTHTIGVPCYDFDDGCEYKTRNAFNNSDTNIGPAGSGAMTGVVVGVLVGLWRDDTNPGNAGGGVNGDFGIDVNGTGFKITRILDSNGRDTFATGGTADVIYFEKITIGNY